MTLFLILLHPSTHRTRRITTTGPSVRRMWSSAISNQIKFVQDEIKIRSWFCIEMYYRYDSVIMDYFLNLAPSHRMRRITTTGPSERRMRSSAASRQPSPGRRGSWRRSEALSWRTGTATERPRTWPSSSWLTDSGTRINSWRWVFRNVFVLLWCWWLSSRVGRKGGGGGGGGQTKNGSITTIEGATC